METHQIINKLNVENIKYFPVMVPLWDNFLYQLYRNIICRNAGGIKTSYYDLSNITDLRKFLEVLIIEYKHINHLAIKELLPFCEAYKQYYLSLISTQTKNTNCNDFNAVFTFNELIHKNSKKFSNYFNTSIVVIPTIIPRKIYINKTN